MRKNHRFAFLVIGGLGLLAAVAPGLAAGLIVQPAASGTPAAGQGEILVQGFEVQDINWSVTDEGRVVAVTFTIFRQDDEQPLSSVQASNATVRVRLNDGTNDKWNECSLPASGTTTGSATCNTTLDSVDVDANDLVKVEILAFDSN